MRQSGADTAVQNIDLSIVIPVYNEESIVVQSIRELVQGLQTHAAFQDLHWELILSANGCVDQTVPLFEAMQQNDQRLRLLESPEANYGKALKKGILAAHGRWVICDEIDLGDLDFYRRALTMLQQHGYDLIVGSKRMPESNDKRPALRRLASSGVTLLLRAATGFRGTDTHGLKAFERKKLLPVVKICVVDKDMFASELVVRAHRDPSLRAGEIPVHVQEKRAPSIHLVRRVPNVLKQLIILAWVIRVTPSNEQDG